MPYSILDMMTTHDYEYIIISYQNGYLLFQNTCISCILYWYNVTIRGLHFTVPQPIFNLWQFFNYRIHIEMVAYRHNHFFYFEIVDTRRIAIECIMRTNANRLLLCSISTSETNINSSTKWACRVTKRSCKANIAPWKQYASGENDPHTHVHKKMHVAIVMFLDTHTHAAHLD